MKTSNVFVIFALIFAMHVIAYDKKNKPSLDYALTLHILKNLEKTKNLYRGYLIDSYEKNREEYIQRLLKDRAAINAHIEKCLNESRISQKEYESLIDKSFASLANLYVEFPSLNPQNIDTLLEEIS